MSMISSACRTCGTRAVWASVCAIALVSLAGCVAPPAPPAPGTAHTTWAVGSLGTVSELPTNQVGRVNVFAAPEEAGATITVQWRCAGTTYAAASATTAAEPWWPYALASVPFPSEVLGHGAAWARANCSIVETHPSSWAIVSARLLANSDAAYGINVFHHSVA